MFSHKSFNFHRLSSKNPVKSTFLLSSLCFISLAILFFTYFVCVPARPQNKVKTPPLFVFINKKEDAVSLF